MESGEVIMVTTENNQPTIRKPPAPESVFVGEAVYKWVVNYYKQLELKPNKSFGISFRKPNKHEKNWSILVSVDHTAPLPYNADEDLSHYLNTRFVIPRYKVSVIQDTTYNYQNFHIRLIKR
jgi:hypothetical protein